MKQFALGTTLLALSMPAIAVSQKLSFAGIAPVRVGMTVPQAEHVLHAKLTTAYSQANNSTDCGFAFIKGRDRPFSYMVERGQITRADLGGRGVRSSIRTANGIGLGSNIAEIKRAYEPRGQWHPNAYSDEPVFEIKSADRKSAMLFETEHGRVVHVIAGRLPSAEYIEGCD